MYEIEIKAHVYDCAAVKNSLEKFAAYEYKTEKHDTYYRHVSISKNCVTARIREEKITAPDSPPRTEFLLTYKRKELRAAEDGAAAEVNEENECSVSDAAVLEKFFADCGFEIFQRKQKFAESFSVQTPAGKARIELCEIPPLGNFVEIEIMAQENDSATVESARAELYTLLEKCGIKKSAVETKYYGELLNEAASKISPA